MLSTGDYTRILLTITFQNFKKMKFKNIFLIISFCPFCFISCNTKGQIPEQKQIDSLVNVLVKERRQWNEASEKLIAIGEPSVDELTEVLIDKTRDSWVRRKAAMTLKGIN